MVKLADTLALGASGAIHGGSTPLPPTKSAEGGFDPEQVKNLTKRKIFGAAKDLKDL